MKTKNWHRDSEVDNLVPVLGHNSLVWQTVLIFDFIRAYLWEIIKYLQRTQHSAANPAGGRGSFVSSFSPYFIGTFTFLRSGNFVVVSASPGTATLRAMDRQVG